MPKRSEPRYSLVRISDNNTKSNNKNRTKANPILLTLDEKSSVIENFFTRRPEPTEYARGLLGGSLSIEDSDQYAPIDEKQLKTIFPGAVATKMVDPLSRTDKIRIHENVRRDGATKLALSLLSYFMLGKTTTISLGLSRKYANKEREKAALAMIQSNETYLNMLEEIMNRDDEANLIKRQIALIGSAHAFGRAVALKQYDKEGFPVKLISLASARLGRNWVDKRDWSFLGVEYLDYTKGKRILLAKDIVHYEVDDWHITPNSLYYGMATAENLISLGEMNRVANETSKPEIIKKMWAPIMLVKSMARSQQTMRQLRDDFKTGKTLFFNDDIEVTVIPLQHDLEKLMTTTKENEKAIFRGFTVPVGASFEDDPNRATLEKSLQAWYDGPLRFKRALFDQVMWKQWYKPQVVKMLPVDSDPKNIPFRIVTEYENIRTDTFLETSTALLGWNTAGLLNDDITRTEGGLGKYNDDMNADAMNKTTLNNNMMSQEQALLMNTQQQQPGEKKPQPLEDISTGPLTS